MKRWHPFLFALLWLCEASAQQPFQKVYYSTASAQMNLIELSDHSLLTAFAWSPGISLMDADGNIAESHCYWGDSILTMQSLKRWTDDELYFVTGYRKDSCTAMASITIPYNHPVIGKMDSEGNISAFNYYVLSAGEACGNIPSDLEITHDKSLITWGREDDFFVLKVDSNLMPVWARRFQNNGGFRFIKELPGGDLLAGFDMVSAGASVARLGADGKFIWCRSYVRPLGSVHDALIESDSSFVITGYTGTGSTGRLFMMNLDGNGQVQWCRGYGCTPDPWYTLLPSRLERTLDNKYMLLANLGQSQFPYAYQPVLMKTDLSGDTIWTRTMGATDYVFYTRDLLAHSDGGFLFSGIVWGALPEMNTGLPYIFKTDSLGHFSCGERSHPFQIEELFLVDSALTLTSTDGALVHPGYVTDTLFDPINVYDACTFLPTGVSPNAHPPAKMSIRPNPNTGRFTLEFKDPLQAESWYSVYDTTGKLLYQRPLPTGKGTEEVDLSRYGRGTYVIKCTDKEGVYHERVVVE